jgi:hypothetical protein
VAIEVGFSVKNGAPTFVFKIPGRSPFFSKPHSNRATNSIENQAFNFLPPQGKPQYDLTVI